jgi:hypothetical protein
MCLIGDCIGDGVAGSPTGRLPWPLRLYTTVLQRERERGGVWKPPASLGVGWVITPKTPGVLHYRSGLALFFQFHKSCLLSSDLLGISRGVICALANLAFATIEIAIGRDWAVRRREGDTLPIEVASL